MARMCVVLAAVFLAALAIPASLGYELEEGVIVGTDANFHEIVNSNDFVLAEFYAPWCGHCKSLAPEYAKAATQLAESGSPVKLVKVDATIHGDVAKEFAVQGYPTLKFFNHGQAVEYSGGRQAKDIVAWVSKRSGPATHVLETVEAATALVEGNEVVAIGFFNSATDAEAVAFTSAADRSESIYGLSTKPEVAAHYGVTAPKIVLLKKFDEGRVNYDGAFETEAIETFVNGNQLPYVIEFSDSAAQKIFGGAVKSHLLLFAKKSAEEHAKWVEAMSEAAKESLGKILFVTVNADAPEHSRILEFFGLKAENTPAVRIINLNENMAKFKPETAEITGASLKAFASGYLTGTLKQHLMTEALPADWDAKPVKVLTGENFDSIVNNPEKYVFVEFYAPWCGHCKSLAPIWDELAKNFESNPNVVIAKIDSTANELSSVKIQSFPTLKFYRAGSDKAPQDYSGGRDLAALTEFLNTETGSSVAASEEDGGSDEHQEL